MTQDPRTTDPATVQHARRDLAELNRVLAARSDALVRAEAELRAARQRITDLMHELDARSRELHVMRTSESWRITEPIRRAGARGRRVAQWGRRLLTRLADAAGSPVAGGDRIVTEDASVAGELEVEGDFLRPYFRSVGFHDPPIATYRRLRDAGWPVYPTRAAAESVAAVIRASDLFDPGSYAAGLRGASALDPALHYVVVGERMGLPPSAGFDPTYYGKRYPDLARSGTNLLAHFLALGRDERRRPLSAASTLRYDRSRIDPGRDTVLLICPHAARTRTAIVAENVGRRLARTYNVVAVFLGGGELVPQFAASCAAFVGPLIAPDVDALEAECLIEHLCASYAFRFALVNGVESHEVLRPLAQRLLPVVTLVHEFAASAPPAPWRLRPQGEGPALDWSTEVVFSAELVARAARRDHPTLMGHRTHVLRPGRCDEPPHWGDGGPPLQDDGELGRLFRLKGADRALVVLGGGALEFRSGVDLFVSCAAAVAERCEGRPVRFVWIGRGDHDPAYWSYLADHIADWGLAETVTVLHGVADAKAAAPLADVFFLASRLDPTPDAALEAALGGIPVVCFEGATGIAEVLGGDAVGRRCVVPRLDAAAAARLIAEFARDEGARAEAGAATRRLAETTLDMDRYAHRVDEVAREAFAVVRRRVRDLEIIRQDPLFDEHVYLPPDHPSATRDEAIVDFLTRWDAVGLSRQAALNGAFRRPCVGFHPQVYAHETFSRCDDAAPNPLADFIRRGKPDGPWRSELITPSPPSPSRRRGLRVALHAHFHYPELASELMQRLALNAGSCDLWLSTDTDAKARALGAPTVRWERGEVRIRVLPNRGRDLAPLLTTFAEALARDYDVVGHLHGKRSLMIADATVGEAWREFLWQHLLGGRHPMLDVIVDRFAAEDDLGLVFAADPHLPDWSANLAIATDLAERMGIMEPLPPFFDFPVGTMFWARPQALRPLFELKLDWPDYPEEPAPVDGTLLHALERLLPIAARHAGYRCATTHVAGVTW